MRTQQSQLVGFFAQSLLVCSLERVHLLFNGSKANSSSTFLLLAASEDTPSQGIVSRFDLLIPFANAQLIELTVARSASLE
jgi:hypothetical protein